MFICKYFVQKGFLVDDRSGSSWETRILIALRRVIRAVDIYSRKLYAATGLTTPQLVCLHALAAAERMTLTELALAVSLGISTVNGIVDRLEAKGLLVRVKSREDRRKIQMQITSTGADILLKAPSLLQDRLAQALGNLPESERRILTESLERVVLLMEAERVDASPNLFTGTQLEPVEKQASQQKDVSC